jgi:hypothetical protein
MAPSYDLSGDSAVLPGRQLTLGEVHARLGALRQPQLAKPVRDILRMAQRLADQIATCQGGQWGWVLSDEHAQQVAQVIDQLPPDPHQRQLADEMSQLRSQASGYHFAKEMLSPAEHRALSVLEAVLGEWDRYHGGYAHQLLSDQQCLQVADNIKIMREPTGDGATR